MASLTGDTTAIHRLTIKAERACQGKAAAVRAQLTGGDWPQAAGEEWVFIRRLHAKATARQLPVRLLQDTRAAMQSDDRAQVIRFANLAELLAALAQDLTAGSVDLRWYWRRWQHWFALPQGSRVAALADEHPDQLPAVTAVLARSGGLASVWRGISPSAAVHVAANLATRSGIRLPSDFLTLDSTAVLRSEGAPVPVDTATTAPAGGLPIPHSLLERWRPIVAALSAGDGRAGLAALLVAQESVPLWLQTRPTHCLAAIMHDLKHGGEPDSTMRLRESANAEAISTEAISTPLPVAAEFSITASMAVAGGYTESASSDTRKLPDVEAKPKQVKPAGDSAARSLQPLPAEISELSDQSAAAAVVKPEFIDHKEPADAALIGSQSPIAEQSNALAYYDRFATEQGGLLYLLNMLNRPEMRRLMLAHAENLPNAWIWLYRLGQQLDLREDDPLVDYLAAQLNCGSRAELAGLPPLPDTAQVLDWAWRWYGKADVWQPALLQLPARFVYTPSHIDLYAEMSAVRLPVRLAGLDINPGWLPWLGKVVTFHYD